MNRPVHFEIPADNPEQLTGFYQNVFGWTFRKWGGDDMPYWLAMTGEGQGINGGIMKKQHPGQGVCNTIEVENVDVMTEKVTQAGGVIVMPKMAVPGIGWLVYATDTGGNTFGMMQMDQNAK